MRITNTLSYLLGFLILVASIGNVAVADQPSAMMASKQSATATVEKVDTANRKLTMKDAEGNSVTMKVPESVKMFDAIKKGDRVDIEYYESIGISMKKAEPGAQPSAKETIATAREGGKLPGGAVARQITATVMVQKVDKANNKVTIKAPDGSMHTIHVTDPAIQGEMAKLKQGDMIQATYTEAVAMSVERPEKKG